jgi:hypothetical protein
MNLTKVVVVCALLLAGWSLLAAHDATPTGPWRDQVLALQYRTVTPAQPGGVSSATGCGLVDHEAIRATIRHYESGGRYDLRPNAGGASGAYQFIDKTWDGFGGYRSAYLAPPAVQDAAADRLINEVLGGTNDVTRVHLGWYLPAVFRNPALLDVVPNPEVGNRFTPRQYQQMWMATYAKLSSPCT